ncbi:MAG: sulfurtransferase TusA family protein [Aeromonas sp.]
MEYLDLTPWHCPEPLIRLKLWLKYATCGQTVTLLLADAGSWQDIPAYLQRQGHRVTLLSPFVNPFRLQLTVVATTATATASSSSFQSDVINADSRAS